MARVKLPDGRVVHSDNPLARSINIARRPTAKSDSGKLSVKKKKTLTPPSSYASGSTSSICKTKKKTSTQLSSGVLASGKRRDHGASHKGTMLNQWNVANMLNAIKEWQADKNNNIKRPLRELARVWNLPYVTFRRCVVECTTINFNEKHKSDIKLFYQKQKKWNWRCTSEILLLLVFLVIAQTLKTWLMSMLVKTE